MGSVDAKSLKKLGVEGNREKADQQDAAEGMLGGQTSPGDGGGKELN